MDYTQKIINTTLDAKNEVATFNANASVIIDANFELSQGGTTKKQMHLCVILSKVQEIEVSSSKAKCLLIKMIDLRRLKLK